MTSLESFCQIHPPEMSNNRHDVRKTDTQDHSENLIASGSRVAHTLTACVRCRKRKVKCDAGLPRCKRCDRDDEKCEYFDPAKGKRIPRTYVIHLQNKVKALEAELHGLESGQACGPDAEKMVRDAGLVRFKEKDESRYLGPSSGIAMTRLVMELAKQNTNSKSIKEIVPAVKARQIKDRFTKESTKTTSKVYPMISDIAATVLPSRDLAENLIAYFNQKAQYMLPTLHEPTFHAAVEDVYNGDTDAYKNFTLRMVIAISMQKYDTCYAGLADSYYLAALPYLENATKPMNIGTLQCFALIAQYSLVTPTRTASYWVVGLAVRLCQELGITEEATVAPVAGQPTFNALEIDMRRRLFWIITSMEFGLAHSLGRPSNLATSPDHINVGFFEKVDDQYITPSGIIPGSPVSFKKLIAIHFFKMRLLQAEIRRKLYLNKREEPKNDQDPWFIGMETKLEEWRSAVIPNDEGSGLDETWFQGRLNTMLVFLHRPSPQIPEPSIRSAQIAFNASVFNLNMQRNQIATKSVDLTWIFTQSLFMALNTVLWALSYPSIRKARSRTEVEAYLNLAQESIYLASQRWPGVESALELYDYLKVACLKVYDGGSEVSHVASSPFFKSSPALSQDIISPPPLSSPMTAISSLPSPYYSYYATPSSPGFASADDQPQDYLTAGPSRHSENREVNSPKPPLTVPEHVDQYKLQQLQGQSPALNSTAEFRDGAFNPISIFNMFPSVLPGLQHWSAPGVIPPEAAYALPQHDYEYYLGAIGEQYSQYMQTPYVSRQPLQTLSQEQQIELMQNLEKDGLLSPQSL